MSLRFKPDKIFAKYPEYLSDLSNVDYTANGTPATGFGLYITMFNDNITLKTTLDIIEARMRIKQILGINTPVMKANNAKDDIKLFATCPKITHAMIQSLKTYGIIMTDIDYAINVENIVTWSCLMKYLKNIDICDNVVKVGNNCLSWNILDSDGDRIRVKIYNKFVDLLESKGMRVILGSSLYELMGNDLIARTMMDFKDNSITRIELTFYKSKLQDTLFYHQHIMDVYKRLHYCPTFKASLKI